MMTLNDFEQTSLTTFEATNDGATLLLFQYGMDWGWTAELNGETLAGGGGFQRADEALADMLESDDGMEALAHFMQ